MPLFFKGLACAEKKCEINIYIYYGKKRGRREQRRTGEIKSVFIPTKLMSFAKIHRDPLRPLSSMQM